MKIGDLVRKKGARGWASHRVIEGSRQCPLYVKDLLTGAVRPSDIGHYEVVEPAERIAERLILGWEEYIPVTAYEVAKGGSSMSFKGATIKIAWGEGIFGFILPGYKPTSREGMVFLREGEWYDVKYGIGAILMPGSKAEVISGGAKPKTHVEFTVSVVDNADDRRHYEIHSSVTMV